MASSNEDISLYSFATSLFRECAFLGYMIHQNFTFFHFKGLTLHYNRIY